MGEDPNYMLKAVDGITGSSNLADPKNMAGWASFLPKGEARVSKVKKCGGDASIAMARGKRRFLFDFKLQLSWSLTMEEDTPGAAPGEKPPVSTTSARGTLSMTEVNDAVTSEKLAIGVDWSGSKPTDPSKAALADKWLENLKEEVRARYAAFIEEYHSQ